MSHRPHSFLLSVLPILVLLLGACGGGGPAGTWQIDVVATKDANKAMLEESTAGQPEEMQKMARDMFDKMFSQATFTLELDKGHALTGNASMPNPMGGGSNDTTFTGTWKDAGAGLSLTMKDQGGQEQAANATISGGKMTMTMEEGGQMMTMVLRKK